MGQRSWQHDSLGRTLTRTVASDGLVEIRQEKDGTYTVTVRRAVPFHASVSAVVYMIRHVRTFKAA